MNNEINSLPSHYASLLRIQLAAMLCVCIALIPILTSTNFVFGEAPTDTAALYIITFFYMMLFAFFLVQGIHVIIKAAPAINDSHSLKSVAQKMAATAFIGGIFAFVMVGTTVANIAVETSREVANAFLPHHVSLLLSTSFITAISFLAAKKTVETSIAQKEIENVTGPDGSFPE